MELSGNFLGAVTVLKWACSQPILPLPSILCSLISTFPINLTLVKGVGPLANASSDDTGSGSVEQFDWGTIVSHCHSAYWECLLFCLKQTRHNGVQTQEDERDDDGRVTIGSKDVVKVVHCCLESLDVAAGSVGTVIECVSHLVPQV